MKPRRQLAACNGVYTASWYDAGWGRGGENGWRCQLQQRLNRYLLLAAVTESTACHDSQTTVVCNPAVAVTFASSLHLMSFVEFGNANPWLGKRYHLHRSLFSLSHAIGCRLHGSVNPKWLTADAEAQQLHEQLWHMDSWYLTHFIAGTMWRALLVSRLSVG